MLPDRLLQKTRAYQESRVLLSAIELDLFTAVAQGATSAEAASALGTDPRATAMLMHALVALGMLTKRDGVFYNSPDAARYFVKGSPEDQRMATMHTVNQWRRWSNLTECVHTGTAVEEPEMPARGTDWAESFIAAMHANALERAPHVVQAADAAMVRRMLDIGGGSGAYSIAFAKANPALKAEVLDLETVVPIAWRHIEEAGLKGRVAARAGDLRKGSLGSGYDLIFLSAICHMLSPAENLELFRKSFAALEPGGRIVIQDFIIDPDRTGPPAAALFALNMLVSTKSGDTYTAAEYTSWLHEAGFSGVRRVELPGPADLIVGNRPK